jgi:transmembrane sensor
MDQEEIYHIIGKELAGEANEGEKKRLTEWKLAHIHNQATYDSLKKVWNNTRLQGEKGTVAAFEKVLRKINHRKSLQTNRVNQGQSPIFKRYFYRAAAVILVILSVAIYRFNLQPIETSADTSPVPVIQKVNPPGQKSRVHLPDGSIVWLNAESELQFPHEFDSLSRIVQLSGEAFFEVAKDPKRPFTVETGDLKTTAIGTTFNIKAFQDQNFVLVALASGKVKVASNETNAFYLNPGNCIQYNKDDQHLKLIENNIAVVTGWKDGILLFKEADFHTIIQELERWYGVKIQVINKPRQDITFSGKFTNEYLGNVLESMSFGRPFSYSIEDKSVTIKF